MPYASVSRFLYLDNKYLVYLRLPLIAIIM